MATLYFIRHGQAQFGMEDYDQLSALGIQQAKVLGQELKARNIEFNSIQTGYMKRQQQTAEHCIGVSLAKINTAWNEFNHREVLSKYDCRYEDINQLKLDVLKAEHPKDAIKTILQGAIQRWTSGQYNDYEETWQQFEQRVITGLQEVGKQLEKNDKVAIFTSGGVISILLKYLNQLSIEQTFVQQLYIANASITTLKPMQDKWQLMTFNEHEYLLREQKQLLTFR